MKKLLILLLPFLFIQLQAQEVNLTYFPGLTSSNPVYQIGVVNNGVVELKDGFLVVKNDAEKNKTYITKYDDTLTELGQIEFNVSDNLGDIYVEEDGFLLSLVYPEENKLEVIKYGNDFEEINKLEYSNDLIDKTFSSRFFKKTTGELVLNIYSTEMQGMITYAKIKGSVAHIRMSVMEDSDLFLSDLYTTPNQSFLLGIPVIYKYNKRYEKMSDKKKKKYPNPYKGIVQLNLYLNDELEISETKQITFEEVVSWGEIESYDDPRLDLVKEMNEGSLGKSKFIDAKPIPVELFDKDEQKQKFGDNKLGVLNSGFVLDDNRALKFYNVAKLSGSLDNFSEKRTTGNFEQFSIEAEGFENESIQFDYPAIGSYKEVIAANAYENVESCSFRDGKIYLITSIIEIIGTGISDEIGGLTLGARNDNAFKFREKQGTYTSGGVNSTGGSTQGASSPPFTEYRVQYVNFYQFDEQLNLLEKKTYNGELILGNKLYKQLQLGSFFTMTDAVSSYIKTPIICNKNKIIYEVLVDKKGDGIGEKYSAKKIDKKYYLIESENGTIVDQDITNYIGRSLGISNTLLDDAAEENDDQYSYMPTWRFLFFDKNIVFVEYNNLYYKKKPSSTNLKVIPGSN